MNDHVNNRKNLELSAGVRGLHYYQKISSPKEGKIFNCFYERDNAFDVFAIKTEPKNASTVGHLPRKVSRITKFIFDRGGKVTATLTSTSVCRSPLVQGGLKIACEVTVKIPATIKNHMILDRFKEFVNEYYMEPTDEEILGFSRQPFPMILQYEHKKLPYFKEKRKNGQIQK